MFQFQWLKKTAPMALLTAGFVAFGSSSAFASIPSQLPADQAPTAIERSFEFGTDKRELSRSGQSGMPGGGATFGPAEAGGSLKASRDGVTVSGHGKGCGGGHAAYESERGSAQGAGSGCVHGGGGAHLGTDGVSGRVNGGGSAEGSGSGEMAGRSAGGSLQGGGEASASGQGGPQGASGEAGGEGHGGGSVTAPNGNSYGGSVSTDDLPFPTHFEFPAQGGELPQQPELPSLG